MSNCYGLFGIGPVAPPEAPPLVSPKADCPLALVGQLFQYQ